MSIYKIQARIHSDKSTEEKLYELLRSNTYKSNLYKTEDLGGKDGCFLKEHLWLVLNNNNKLPFEFMDSYERLVTVTNDDIDWITQNKSG